jgi:rubrerythrin
MSMGFNAREVYAMGVQIETNGKLFYEAAARKTAETSMRDFFRELAAWENQHIELFQKMMDGLPKDQVAAGVFDPEGEEEDYLRATADSHVFIRNTDIAGLVARCATSIEILDLAITFEKDSIVFYATMKKVVADGRGRESVDRLIDEELKHVSLLGQRRQKLAARGP